MRTSPRGVRLICEFEGFRDKAYKCPAGVWTIGYGFTEGVKEGDTISRAAAEKRLVQELVKYEAAVYRACTFEPNQNQFDALVCFAFNIGTKGMAGSSVIKAHNRGDFQAASRAFSLWNKAGGKVFPGLTRRRAAEAALYLEPTYVSENTAPDMPQAIDPETPMTSSTINRASVVAGGTAAIASATEVVNTVNGLKYGLDGLGNWLVPALLVLVVGLCGYVVWQRFQQRKGGWA